MGTTDTDEQWLSVSKPINQLWPELLEFFEGKNHPIELEDGELGVLETVGHRLMSRPACCIVIDIKFLRNKVIRLILPS